jgi:hypothetical protein
VLCLITFLGEASKICEVVTKSLRSRYEAVTKSLRSRYEVVTKFCANYYRTRSIYWQIISVNSFGQVEVAGEEWGKLGRYHRGSGIAINLTLFTFSVLCLIVLLAPHICDAQTKRRHVIPWCGDGVGVLGLGAA